MQRKNSISRRSSRQRDPSDGAGGKKTARRVIHDEDEDETESDDEVHAMPVKKLKVTDAVFTPDKQMPSGDGAADVANVEPMQLNGLAQPEVHVEPPQVHIEPPQVAVVPPVPPVIFWERDAEGRYNI